MVVDPVDGSTNCSRHLPYWAISLCALDADGPLCALVQNDATGARYTAVRGKGAFRDGVPLTPSVDDRARSVGDRPVGHGRRRSSAWKQFRALGSAALVAVRRRRRSPRRLRRRRPRPARPWDYLGGLLVCREAGAAIVDAAGDVLEVADADARRHLVAAGTPELLGALRDAVAP